MCNDRDTRPQRPDGFTQPVAWLPWGAEAFERARAESRPILLDIGAVWCHWCHVMDRESYEDETARADQRDVRPGKGGSR
jgi:thiol:disulfide interchange protein